MLKKLTGLNQYTAGTIEWAQGPEGKAFLRSAHVRWRFAFALSCLLTAPPPSTAPLQNAGLRPVLMHISLHGRAGFMGAYAPASSGLPARPAWPPAGASVTAPGIGVG